MIERKFLFMEDKGADSLTSIRPFCSLVFSPTRVGVSRMTGQNYNYRQVTLRALVVN